MNNIDTNFRGLPNLASSTALHHQSLACAIAAAGDATAAATVNIVGVFEAGTIFRNITVTGDNLPALTGAAATWSIFAISEVPNTAAVTIATIAEATRTVTGVNLNTPILAAASGNFRLTVGPTDAGNTYQGAPAATAFNVNATYNNSH